MQTGSVVWTDIQVFGQSQSLLTTYENTVAHKMDLMNIDVCHLAFVTGLQCVTKEWIIFSVLSKA